jgi:hypothetical protein
MATINDLVLVHLDRQPAFYARINDVNPDVKRGWYQVELLALTLPPQTMVWILEESHLNGEEFTMGGRPVQLVLVPPKPAPGPEEPPEGKGRIIPLVRKT